MDIYKLLSKTSMDDDVKREIHLIFFTFFIIVLWDTSVLSG